MSDTGTLVLAVVTALAGMGWLALAMETHWAQVWGTPPLSPAHVRGLRVLGAASLLASFRLCVLVDHPSMAVLVWVMTLAVAAVSVAALLSWHPRSLALLTPWRRTKMHR